jgi:hypothetical protein
VSWGLLLAGCPYKSRASEACSSGWLPVWLPGRAGPPGMPLAKHTGHVTQSGPREGLPGGADVPWIISAYDNDGCSFHQRANRSMRQW